MTENDLREMIGSWENLLLTMNYISDNPEYLGLLMKTAMDDRLKDSWRACWLINKIHEKNPGMFESYVCQIIDFLLNTSDSSKKRELLKLICFYPIPDDKAGLILDYCLNQFTSASEPVAVRVHAMQMLFNISEREPELKPELIQLIEHEMEYHPSAGIKSRGGKLLHKLNKQISQNRL